MSDQELSPAAIADREAVRIDFIRNIRQHALDDAYNHARPQIRVRLRSPENLKLWSTTLEQLKREVTKKEARELINAKICECSTLRQAEARVAQITAQNKIQEARKDYSALIEAALRDAGYEQPVQMGLAQMQTIILCDIVKELRKLNA